MSLNSSSGHRGRGSRGPGSSFRGRGRGNGERRGAPPIDRAAVPRGICVFYWTTGACDRNFDCRFKHEARALVPSESSASEPAADDTPDFFSLEGLAINNGSVVDTQHTLRPTEAHNYLRPYLFDNFVFRDAIHVESFSRIFASVNSRNRAWDSDQAQAFLDSIVHGNALPRIGDVLRFSPVAIDAGASSATLSYQKGYFPIFEFLSSDLVLKSTMHQNINKIYTLIDQNFEVLRATTRECMSSMIDAQTWEDRSLVVPTSRRNTLNGVIVFKTLSTVLSQYLARFKHAIRNRPELRDFVEDLFSWFSRWATAVKKVPPAFRDPIVSSNPQIRNLTLAELEKDVSRLRLITDREHGHTEKLRRRVAHATITAGQMQQALISHLSHTYDPPGTLRDGGEPRHDNDFADIGDIRIAPTHEELLCSLPPYLPVFLPVAPHHLPENSMQRHLDIQFRLLREEMVYAPVSILLSLRADSLHQSASIRQSIGEICRDLEIMRAPSVLPKQNVTMLEKLLKSKGGAYKTSGINSVFFHLYTGARFAPVEAERRNLTVGLLLDPPPGVPRDQSGKKRAEFWERSNQLQHGNLVALVLISPGQSQVFLGIIISMGADIAESAKKDVKTIQLRVSFFDPEIEFMALRQQPISTHTSRYAILLDNGIMLESLYPFLRTLQEVEPTSIPFSNYISHSGRLDSLKVEPPRYARAPLFRYDLQCLARSGHKIRSLNVNNESSVALARRQLLSSSNLDPSRADALIDTLTREVSLIQGPPGTGKSFTAKEILRVLFRSKIKPIVLIAFTNHALDHMLTSILDAQITTNVVRLGSRTTDERIAQYTLHKLERLPENEALHRLRRREYAALKQIEDDLTRVMNQMQLSGLTWKDAEKFLDFQYPQHADSLREPPFWIAEVFRRITEDEKENGEWTQVSKGKKANQDPEITGIYGFWKNGGDIEFIQSPSTSKSKGDGGVDPRQAFFEELSFSGMMPSIPPGQRSLENLITSTSDVWSMSLSERKCLAQSWEDDMRRAAYEINLEEFHLLKKRYKVACKGYEDVQDALRRGLLSRADLIACTTTGAAKLISLLTSIRPKVVMVEEAGQVLEAHILASLVPSVEHLICIGDPQQLRPNISTFSLSMDSTSGRE
ncbi:AAA domain-containing protein [Russula compacta]|nr:AAA domain-containing protein [Russula compacta]